MPNSTTNNRLNEAQKEILRICLPDAESTKTAFIAGYEKGKVDAIDRCLMERIPKSEPDWRSHNVALGLAITAIRALDVRHAIPVKETKDDDTAIPNAN